MIDEELPLDEPGRPLVRTKPGFMDKLMRQVEEIDRQRARRRRNARTAACLVVVAAVGVLVARNHFEGTSPALGPVPIAHRPPAPPPVVIAHRPAAKPPEPHLEAAPGGGVVVRSLPAESRLAKAGVQPGDRVTSIEHQPVNDAALAAALLHAMENCKPKEIELVRDNRQRTITTPPFPGPCGGGGRPR